MKIVHHTLPLSLFRSPVVEEVIITFNQICSKVLYKILQNIHSKVKYKHESVISNTVKKCIIGDSSQSNY